MSYKDYGIEFDDAKNQIVFGQKLYTGKISKNNRFDITKEVIIFLIAFLVKKETFQKDGFAGFECNLCAGHNIKFGIIDTKKFEIKKRVEK